MFTCPIDFFTDNLIFNEDKSCWAVFQLSGYDYDFLNIDNKINKLRELTHFLSDIISEAQILVIPIQQDIETHYNTLKNNLDKNDTVYKNALYQLEQTEEYLKNKIKEDGNINDYRTYIVIKLEDYCEFETVKKLNDGFQYFIKNPINAINVYFGLDTKDILKSKLDKCNKMAQKWLDTEKKRMKLEKATITDLQWLFKRMNYRGTNKKIQLYKDWQPHNTIEEVSGEEVIRPYTRDIVNLFNGVITTQKRVLTVDTDDTKSYQTFLTLAHLPDTLAFPGMEWLYLLQQQNTQAEICIHMKAIEYRSGLKKLDYKKREIKSQIEHIEEAGETDLPDDLEEGKAYMKAIEYELKESRCPLLYTSISICLASDNLDDLENKVSTVKTLYNDLNFQIERPLTDQYKLYLSFFPSVTNTIKDFILPLTPQTLASGVFGATRELGDTTGYYIGTTGIENKNVFLDMGLACLLNKSASACFYGNLGVGKSFNANLLMYLNILNGGYGLIFDPKAERSHWETEMTVFKGLITTVTLTPDRSCRGKLDPYNLYHDDIDSANDLAINILTELFKLKGTGDEITVIEEATRRISDTKINGRPSMNKLAEILDNFDENDDLYNVAKRISRKMRLKSEVGMSSLLFGDGTENAITLDNRLNILQIQNLQLPSPEISRENYTAEENLSTILMMVLSHFAKRFALTKRPVFKMILFDESWMLGKTAEGVKLFDFLARMGRSLYSGCIFNGHSVTDIPETGIKNAITYKFIFKTDNKEEASNMLKFLNLQDTEENRDTLMQLGNGECLFQDVYERTGVLKFDAVFSDIINIFSTTPTTKEKGVG